MRSEVWQSEKCVESGGGATSGQCTASYEGPTADPQVSTQCMAIWNHRCVAGDSARADQNCRVYDSLDANVACPYC